MGKIFQFTPNTRSFMDNTSGVVPTNTSVVFKRLEKGFAAHFSPTADLDTFGIVEGVKTVVMVIKPTANTKLLQNNGADKLEITAGNISGTGLTECTVNAIDTDAVANNLWSLVIAEFSGGIDFSTDFEIDVTAEVGIVSIVCYDEILSGLQKGELWDEFNHLSPVSTPNIVRHHIPVDPTGSVLCHDYQRWNGGVVPDLSGNGNDGTPNGFVDVASDSARFDGSTGYIQSTNTGMTDTEYFIEMLIKPHDVTIGQYICDQTINKRTVILGFQNGYFNFYDGVYPTGNPLDTVIPATLNEWQYLVMGTNGTKVYGYKNGVKVVEEIGTWIAGGIVLFQISGLGGAFYANASVKFIKVHNSILTEAKIRSNWNNIARLVIFNEPVFNQLPDNRSYTAGMYLEKWQISSGTFMVKEDSTGTYIECSGNGVIQYKGVDLSMNHENGFIKSIVGDISSDQGDTVDNATYIAWVSNVLSVTMATGEKLYELVIQAGEEQ